VKFFQQTRKFFFWVAPLAVIASLSACSSEKKPTGQVVASIDGSDITLRDLQSELTATGFKPGPVSRAQRSELLEQVIQRKLLAAEARSAGIDKSPDYLASVQRMREVLLTSALLNQRALQYPNPSESETQQFVSDNPQIFADRKIYTLDQISTASEGIPQNDLKALETNDQIAKYLTLKKHQFARQINKVDGATLSKDLVSQIDMLSNGTSFIVARGSQLIISSKVYVESSPIDTRKKNELAIEMLRKRDLNKAVEDQISYRRKSAKIVYSDGYAPKKDQEKD